MQVRSEASDMTSTSPAECDRDRGGCKGVCGAEEDDGVLKDGSRIRDPRGLGRLSSPDSPRSLLTDDRIEV